MVVWIGTKLQGLLVYNFKMNEWSLFKLLSDRWALRGDIEQHAGVVHTGHSQTDPDILSVFTICIQYFHSFVPGKTQWD